MNLFHTYRISLLPVPFLSLFLFASVSSAEVDVLNDQTGIISVLVEDDKGQIIPEAPIYIFDGHHIQVVLSNDQGTAVVTMQSGRYTVSSSLCRPSPNFVDRFASPEANVEIIPGDTTSVVLSLNPVSNHVSSLSYSTLQ